MSGFVSDTFTLAYANSLDAFIPELWAMESIAILEENMVAASLVHRDFEQSFQNFGDVVNTRKPADFSAKRKTSTDDVTIQDASATNVAVPLDQHIHTSFLIRDGEETKAFKSLVDEYLRPAAISMARFVDQIVLAQHVHFINNQAGSLGGLTSSNAVTQISGANLVMNKNKAPMAGRNMIWTPEAESLVVQNAVFHEADKRGDTIGLMDASLGRKLGWDHYMAQNMSQIINSNTLLDGAVNNAAGYPAGTTSIAVDAMGASTNYSNYWISINGKVYKVASGTMTTGAGTLVLSQGLHEAVADNDVVYEYPIGSIDLAAGYAAGYSKEILIDDGAGALPPTIAVGQILSIGANDYVAIEVTEGATETSVLLDRPLEAAVADNAVVTYGPEGGGVNFGFHRNALALVVRPLQLPRTGTGTIAGQAFHNGVAMRVVVTYDGTKQGHLVTLDFLAGVKVLDSNLGCVVLS